MVSANHPSGNRPQVDIKIYGIAPHPLIGYSIVPFREVYYHKKSSSERIFWMEGGMYQERKNYFW